jgi:hypothetical protein
VGGILAIVVGAGLLWTERKLTPLSGSPTSSEEEEPSYAPCSNCGFRLAEKYPPTEVTYPFNVVSCPICGMRMDDEGFVAGEALDPEQRQASLTRWLENHGFVPQQVYSRWGFGVEDFFEPGAVATGGQPILPPGRSHSADQDPDRR